MSISFEYAPTVIAFHACPGLSTRCSVLASGNGAFSNSFGYTFPALTIKSRFTFSSSAPDVILSTAADHEVGLPSNVLYSGEVTAIQITLFMNGLAISAKDTACSVIAPYKSGSFPPVGGKIFTDSIFCGISILAFSTSASFKLLNKAMPAISVPCP